MFYVVRTLSKAVLQQKNLAKCIKLQMRCKVDFLTSSFRPIEIPSGVLPEFIFEHFHKYPKAIALECEHTGKKYSFEDVRRKSMNLNTNLRKKLKLKKGDVVAVLLPNVADFPVCVFGALQAGLAVTTLNPLFTPEELSHPLRDANVKAVFTLTSTHNLAKVALQASNISAPIITIKTKESDSLPEGAIDLCDFTKVKADVNEVELHPNDLALVVYSSGTTGLPKGVQHTHQTLITNICQVNSEEVRYFPDRSATYESKHLALAPWFSAYGITAVLNKHLRLLTKLICIPKFTKQGFVKMLAEHQPTGIYLVPSIISFMGNHQLVKPEHLASVSTIVYGTAPLIEADKTMFLSKANRTINMFEGFGLSETNAICCQPLEADEKPARGMKLLVDTCVKITQPDGSVGLNANELGEVLVKGPQIMKGYLNRPNETKDAFTDGWFRTGDLGYYDQDGFVHILDRLKDIIKVNGFQVSPTEVENVIRRHHDIADAAVIGIPHKQYGEVPLAFVVPNNDARRLNVKSLQDFVCGQVAQYKQLKGGVIVVDSLPKNHNGKLLRKNLTSMYQSKMMENYV